MQKCYIAGAITGTQDYEQKFKEASHHVIKLGMVPVNPVTLLHNHDKTWESYMRECLSAMLDCSAIYMLPCYPKSKGANLEHNLARSLNFNIIYAK